MKICVLVKEVPDAAVEKRMDPSTGRMDRSGERNLNPYDTHAIEAAMQIREGGAIEVDEIIAVTMGPGTATRALQKIRGAGALRGLAWSLAAAILCTLVPIAVARWALPSGAEIATLRARRDELAANLAKLEQEGGRIDWRRCGDSRRLCVRVDRKAPTYGDKADYFVIEGY